jgi:hypothetical protein
VTWICGGLEERKRDGGELFLLKIERKKEIFAKVVFKRVVMFNFL